MKRRRPLSSITDHTEEAEVNLTPLIDVVFVVLIMFIIVAPMLELERVNLANASQKEDKEVAVVQETSPLAIYVKEDNTIWLGKKQVGIHELATHLRLARQTSPNRIPQLFHDKKAFFGTYQSVKNTIEEAGFEELDVILHPN